MKFQKSYRVIPLVLAFLFCTGDFLHSEEAARKKRTPSETMTLPKPAEVQSLSIYPTKIVLKGRDDARQLICTAELSGGRLQDLSGDVQYVVADATVVQMTRSGRVLPRANGSTSITAQYGNKQVKIPVQAEAVNEDLPINFANQIVPIFTKLGCNAGGCHGKASGQNGFKLSLLGFEPDQDYASLVKESRGRRVFQASPDHSLLLLKAGGSVAHGGGKRMETDSDEYKLIRRWIASGVPYGDEDDPVVTRISIYPENRILSRHNKQQLAVYAHYSDG
jgi:hypothetical protein